jgi:DNA-3-methyladenine glycosylase II
LEPLLADLAAAIDHWRPTDPVLADLAQAHPPGPWPDANDDPFVALVRAIVHQQVSLAAGRTIYGRFEAAVGQVAPGPVLAAGEHALRGAGLSGQKTSYVLDLAARVADGSLDLARLGDASDDEVVAALTQVKGIGVWSAKMFLLFHLQRPDVCPWEDLGVRIAVTSFYGIPEGEATAWLRDEARPRWSPYNSLAARVLWNARRAVGGGI